eukprot:GHVL01043944.1.p1 GENE.GHVL01043944.1~~GHVL01043944.1.p1  ORF type:complete len:193 (+),score=39.50 GHVL01043944.1:60-581(+)
MFININMSTITNINILFIRIINNFKKIKNISRIDQFVEQFRECIDLVRKEDDTPIVLVFDDAEKFTTLGSSVLSLFLRLSEYVEREGLCTVLISRVRLVNFFPECQDIFPTIDIHFSPFTFEQVQTYLLFKQDNLWEKYIKDVLPRLYEPLRMDIGEVVYLIKIVYQNIMAFV